MGIKDKLLNSLDKMSSKQRENLQKALQEAESDLNKILSKALEKDAAKILKIQHSLDQIWKNYIKDVEKVSETLEEQKQQKLLDSL